MAITSASAIRVTEPLGYVELMNRVIRSTIAITDSGGVQEETTYLALRDAAREHRAPDHCDRGHKPPSEAGGPRGGGARGASGLWTKGSRPALWDGHTAERAARSLRERLTPATIPRG